LKCGHFLTSKKEKPQLGYGSYSDITELLLNLIEDDNPVMVVGELNIDNLIKIICETETSKR
jgi:hypothetical protein